MKSERSGAHTQVDEASHSRTQGSALCCLEISSGGQEIKMSDLRHINLNTMETARPMEKLLENLNSVLQALNKTLNSPPCQPNPRLNETTFKLEKPNRDDNAYIFIIFVMFLFAVTVGSLILGYTRSKKVDKRSDPYHMYIKNSRISVI
ncbi:potassium voltage-gated channel subfamily E member 3 [Hyla sarda]|uniref:potassium voltage-gated channel subfamily E member 3 n=1 Tax=Hyla sarda TaxID=327740 RepID=UPI0024C39CDD|nr:potassium voltage-gated channel subfamily E member 3 [Hyla sarda]